MNRTPTRSIPSRILKFGSLLLSLSATLAHAGYKDDIGYTALQLELSGSLPTGAGVTASQIEAPLTTSGTDYLPDTGNLEFSGKTFMDQTGGGATSWHATTVGRYLYGNSTGIAPGIATIDNWNANDWIGSGFLHTSGALAPNTETRDIQNHSWVGSSGGDATDQEALRRFDYAIERDDFIAVVGVNNAGFGGDRNLLSSAYNAISVGLTSGNHESGLTTVDGPGRLRPHIVVQPPDAATSYATPVVGAAAAMLIETSRDRGWSSGENSETVKAVLLAGATKDEFGGNWNRTETQPLDEHYGAGELNVYHSFYILDAGEQETTGNENLPTTGWDFDQTIEGDLLYFFDVADGNILTEFSIVLTWNRIVTDGVPGPTWGDPQSSLAGLDLRFYQSDGFVLSGTYLDASLSTVENIEHIYLQDLVAGQYALKLTADTADQDFALAWRGSLAAVPEPGVASLMIASLGCVIWALRRNRSKPQ